MQEKNIKSSVSYSIPTGWLNTRINSLSSTSMPHMKKYFTSARWKRFQRKHLHRRQSVRQSSWHWIRMRCRHWKLMKRSSRCLDMKLNLLVGKNMQLLQFRQILQISTWKPCLLKCWMILPIFPAKTHRIWLWKKWRLCPVKLQSKETIIFPDRRLKRWLMSF